MIHILIGTKAQLIKVAPIMMELNNQDIDYNFIFTGQHKATIDKLLKNFNLKNPDYTLDKGEKDITGIIQMFFWLFKCLFITIKNKEEIFRTRFNKYPQKNIILVHGDTISALLGALIGKLLRYRVGHIESGLRSFDYFHPFPEEIIRVLTFKLSDIYYAPGKWATDNLKHEKGERINTQLNTLYDSLQVAIKNENEVAGVEIPSEKYAVVTIHQFENIFRKKQFKKIISLLENKSKKMKIVLILHKPTEKNLKKFRLYDRLQRNENIEIHSRYDYFEFIKLINHSEFVISDGGSNQEETYYLGKSCLLFRKETERQEGIGKNVVLSKFDEKIIKDFIDNYKKYVIGHINTNNSPSKIIVDHLRTILQNDNE